MTIVNELQDEFNVKNSILERGYWKIDIRPVEYTKHLYSLEELKCLLQACQVHQRWWCYPYIFDGQIFGNYHNADNYVESWARYDFFAEIFQFYRSGQFIHHVGMYEDRSNDQTPSTHVPWNPNMEKPCPVPRFLDPVKSLFLLTEIFLFASRLARKGVFGERTHISIKLHNQMNRILQADDPQRPTIWSGQSHSDSIHLVNHTFDCHDLFMSYDRYALDAEMNLLSFFNLDPEYLHSKHLRNSLQSDQSKLYPYT